jgi:hypothetical protein
MARQRLRKRMNGPQPLEQQIAAALSEKAAITSAALATLFGEVETAIAEVETAAVDANTRALDPTIDDPAAARQQRDDCGFRLERLKAALPPLQQRYNEVRLAERKAKWRTDYADVKAKCDDAATNLKDIYGEFTTRLIDALIAAKELDQDVARVNSTAPSGEHDRLLSVECAARGVNAVGPNSALSLLTELKLPRWSAPGWAWPPPTPPIDVRQVVPVKLMTHPMDRWHEGQAERKAETDREAQRVANYYRRQQREQEDMENARARAEQQRRRQAAI